MAVTQVLVEQNVPARMRDGVTLYADVYRPAGEGRYPVLLCRLPYGRDVHLPVMMPVLHPLRAARAGYVVILQDTRGCWASEGEFGYFATLPQEGPDGYDAVEWAASLPYANGEVGMFGASYHGWTQWAAAMQRPPHLRAIAPQVTWLDQADGIVYRGGALELGVLLAWHLQQAPGVVARRLAAAGAGPSEHAAAIRTIVAVYDGLSAGGYSETPLRDLQSLREAGLADLLRYLVDAGPGGLPREARVDPARVEVPALCIGGWYDLIAQGTLDTYTGLRALGRRAHLLMGPWTHANPASTVGEMELGLAASGSWIDLETDWTGVQLRWFDHWLKGIDNGVDREPPVRIFLGGENRWLRLPDWPPAGAEERAFYLQPGGALSGSRPGSDGGADRFTYDPLHPAPTLGGNTLMVAAFPPGIKDQRPLSARPDVLTFTGEPLAQPLTVAGRVTANLWLSSSAPDTDLVARLIDVHPDGYMENVCDGIQRARHRESLSEPRWLEPGVPCALRVDLWSTAHVFKAGHRLAVQVTSSSFPRWDRNWNTKEDPGAAQSGVKAEQTLWHDAAHPSHILLPIVDGESLGAS